jgi:HAD superfamily hydrolase (TIGR01509 family)
MIRGIVFDCFGVLYHGSIGHLYELTAKEHHAELASLSLSSDYGYISHDEYLKQVSNLIAISPADLQTIMNMDHIRNTAMVDYIRKIRPEYKIALLSNVGRGVIDRLFSPAELNELFDTVVLSSEVGTVKPDVKIFSFTSDKLGVPAEDCLMVDDLQDNIDGAVAAGMQGVVFSTTDEFLSAIDVMLTTEQTT